MNERLIYARYFLKNLPGALNERLFHHSRKIEGFSGEKLLLKEGASIIEKAILDEKPCALIRLGGSELSGLNGYEKKRLGFKKSYKEKTRWAMQVRAGYYPTDDESLDQYAVKLLKTASEADLFAVMAFHMEDYFIARYFSHLKRLNSMSLEPLLGFYTHALAGKNVLVITSFPAEVKEQYAKKDKLFVGNNSILPSFNLEVIKAPSSNGERKQFMDVSFFAELEKTKEKMKASKAEIVLIAAGAYSPFLAVEAKREGKVGLQIGGSLQTLFGIIGKRWENREHVKRWINDSWIHPRQKIVGYEKIDGGAYW